MNLKALIASFREDADDFSIAQLWSDETITRFLVEAEEEACIRKRLLFDDYTADAVEIDVTEGVSRYARDPRIFEVTSAFLYRINATRGDRLVFTDRDTMERTCPGWRFDRRTPDRIIIGDVDVYLPCMVNADYTIRLAGFRTPLVPLGENNADQTRGPEISPVHHRYLVHWALHRAYSKPDSETFNHNKSAIALKAFEDYFGFRLQANQPQENQSDRPHHTRAYW